ncbi:GNAT family N-acetyltransferase, partial [Kibdelosporangium lantanae]
MTGWKVRLRTIRPADHRTLATFDRDTTEDHKPGGYRHWATHRDASDDFHLAIETLRHRTLVGSIWVQTDPAVGAFSYGIGIAAQHRRCGYAIDAITALLTDMFERRGYRECVVSVNGRNFPSLALHGELGFHEESRPRDAELRHGEIRYPVIMSITAGQFS